MFVLLNNDVWEPHERCHGDHVFTAADLLQGVFSSLEKVKEWLEAWDKDIGCDYDFHYSEEGDNIFVFDGEDFNDIPIFVIVKVASMDPDFE
jgi:hypothetical protein